MFIAHQLPTYSFDPANVGLTSLTCMHLLPYFIRSLIHKTLITMLFPTLFSSYLMNLSSDLEITSNKHSLPHKMTTTFLDVLTNIR